MTALPPSSDFTTTGITKAQFRSALTSLRAYLSGLFGDAGTQSAALTGIGAPFNDTLTKSAAYTVVAADRGKLIDCTGAGGWTLSADAAATLGDGFMSAVRNSSSGIVTFNPNLSEQVDGALTIAFGPGESGVLLCDGAGWKSVGRATTPSYQAKVSANDDTPGYLNGKLVAGSKVTLTEGSDGGDETLTIAVTGVVSTNVGVSGVGMQAELIYIGGAGTISPGTEVPGSYLKWLDPASASLSAASTVAPSGTWKLVSGMSVPIPDNNSPHGTFQRTS